MNGVGVNLNDKEWYWYHRPEELTGRDPVRVLFENGSVFEGRLVYDGDRYVRLALERGDLSGSSSDPERDATDPPVLFINEDQELQRLPDVKSVELLWDDRSWEQVGRDEVDIATSAIVNGEIWNITQVLADGKLICLDRNYTSVQHFSCQVDPSMVSVFLRNRNLAPARPGFYRDKEGTYWLKASDWWYCLDPTVKPNNYLSEYMDSYMPLTPVAAQFKEAGPNE